MTIYLWIINFYLIIINFCLPLDSILVTPLHTLHSSPILLPSLEPRQRVIHSAVAVSISAWLDYHWQAMCTCSDEDYCMVAEMSALWSAKCWIQDTSLSIMNSWKYCYLAAIYMYTHVILQSSITILSHICHTLLQAPLLQHSYKTSNSFMTVTWCCSITNTLIFKKQN